MLGCRSSTQAIGQLIHPFGSLSVAHVNRIEAAQAIASRGSASMTGDCVCQLAKCAIQPAAL